MAILLKILSFTIWLVIMIALVIGNLRKYEVGDGGDGEVKEVKARKEAIWADK